DIPDWDFDWQYNYQPADTIVIDADDVIRIECGWDRARRDPTLEPAYVLWADGTDDEMCFATLTTRPPSG
ncbi:MAG: monooxygenase, partial [Actinomycetota bacterium]